MEDKPWESGGAKNADTRLLEPPTMSAYSVTILVNAKDKTKAIFDSINVDNKFYPENPNKTAIVLKKNQLKISIESEELPHVRANLNSILRLIQASHDAVKSVEI